MLEPHEKHVFDGMVAGLRAGDPRFARRVGRLTRPPRQGLRTIVAILLWTAAPMCVWLGGWTGFFMAVVGVAYGVHLIKKRAPLTGRTERFRSTDPR
ncbi:DUF3040 domain-containing protein [Actinoplanes sp. NPDC049265]|uniref:DUF3040 domain-containing protein n=1 Tax=Actinoplanes sp. NPDC049265 TaxID=3363902 RepID=UPI0037170291